MLSAKPKVSIGIPIYNGSKWISRTLDSILSQSFTDLEVIISDNASTDDTVDLCEAYSRIDNRVKCIKNSRNIGVSYNYNAVFLESQGEYFKWSSASDLCKQDFIKLCVEVLDTRKDVVLAYPKTLLFNADTREEERYEDRLDLQEDCAADRFIGYLMKVGLNNVMNGMIRSSELRKTGLYKKYLTADVNLLAELTLYGKFVEIPEYLFMRRMEPETATKLQTSEEKKAYYDPAQKSKMLFNNSRIMYEYFLAVYLSNIDLTKKLKIYRFLLRKIYWDKKGFANDILEAFRAVNFNLGPARSRK